MRRLLAGQLAIAAYPVRDWGDGSIIVPPPSGVAAQDNAWIQSAHDLLTSLGGRVRMHEGTYVLNPSALLTLSKPMMLQGCGQGVTILTLASGTATAITANASNVQFLDFSLRNNNGTTPTAGAGIAVSSTGNGNRNRYRDIEINGFFVNLDHQYGNGWIADRCFIYAYASLGVKIQNIDAVDSGDMELVSCQIATSVAADNAAIEWNSGGNLRLSANQIWSGTAPGTGHVGIHIKPTDGINTSDFIIVGNTIENHDYCIAQGLGPLQTGLVQGLVIVGNEIFANAGGQCVNMDPGHSGRFSEIIVSGNRLSGGAYGLLFGAVDTITFGPNQYYGNTTATFTDAGGTTNKTQIGSG